MKPKKTLKSLTELSADEIGVVAAQPEKATPPKPQVIAEAPLEIPANTFPAVPDLHRWGINE